MSTTNSLSALWRTHKSIDPGIELASVLEACSVIAQSIMPKAQVSFAGVQTAATDLKNIFLSPLDLEKDGVYPVPDDKVDVILGETVHELGHMLFSTDKIAMTKEIINKAGIYHNTDDARTLRHIIAVFEDLYVDHLMTAYPGYRDYLRKEREYALGTYDTTKVLNALSSDDITRAEMMNALIVLTLSGGGNLPQDMNHTNLERLSKLLEYTQNMCGKKMPKDKAILAAWNEVFSTLPVKHKPKPKPQPKPEPQQQPPQSQEEEPQSEKSDSGQQSSDSRDEPKDDQKESGEDGNNESSNESEPEHEPEENEPEDSKQEHDSGTESNDPEEENEPEDENGSGDTDSESAEPDSELSEDDVKPEGEENEPDNEEITEQPETTDGEDEKPTEGEEQSGDETPDDKYEAKEPEATEPEPEPEPEPEQPDLAEKLDDVVDDNTSLSPEVAQMVAEAVSGNSSDISQMVSYFAKNSPYQIIAYVPEEDGARVANARANTAQTEEKLRRILQDYRLKQTKDYRGMLSGRVSNRRLYRTGYGDNRVFNLRQRPDEIDMAVELLMDLSGSELRNRNLIEQTIVAIADAFTKEKVEFIAAGYSENKSVAYISRLYDKDSGRVNLGLSEYDYSSGNVGCKAWGNTPSYEGLAAAEAELLKFGGSKKKVLFHFTDGSPNSGGDVIEIMNDIKSRGIAVISICLSGTTTPSSGFIRLYGEDTLAVTSVDELPNVIDQQLRKQLKMED